MFYTTNIAIIVNHAKTRDLLPQLAVVPEARFHYQFPYRSEMPETFIPTDQPLPGPDDQRGSSAVIPRPGLQLPRDHRRRVLFPLARLGLSRSLPKTLPHCTSCPTLNSWRHNHSRGPPFAMTIHSCEIFSEFSFTTTYKTKYKEGWRARHIYTLVAAPN